MSNLKTYCRDFFVNTIKNDKEMLLLSNEISAFIDSGEKEDAFTVFYAFAEKFKLFGSGYENIQIFVLYSLLKLNSPICLDENKIVQKQFGKIISIKYDNITDVKLSESYYVRASDAIKIYDNKKRIMFEISSKVFDVFMKYCANVEVKNKIERLLKEKGIY